jgi:surface polysaccharide O-acyltransferase-like enzyme
MNIKTTPLTEETQSKVIEFLRFPMIIGVLFIHSSTMNVPGVNWGTESYMPIYYVCIVLFSQILGRIAVPFFFFVSGFLFFLNTDFNKQCYKTKLKNRFRTLLLPYLFWNIVVLIFYLILSVSPYKTLLNNDAEFTFTYILKSLWALDSNSSPIAFQFWFIRDLIVIVVLTPIIYLIIKKTNLYGVIFLCFLQVIDRWYNIPGLSISSIFFFTLGAWFSINKRNIIVDMNRIKYLSFVTYPLIVLADLLMRDHTGYVFIHNIGILVGIVFSFNIATCLLNNSGVKVNSFLSLSSFFVFAIHEPLLMLVRKMTYIIFKPSTDLATSGLFFINVIIATFIALILYYLLRNYALNFTKFITGGR